MQQKPEGTVNGFGNCNKYNNNHQVLSTRWGNCNKYDQKKIYQAITTKKYQQRPTEPDLPA